MSDIGDSSSAWLRQLVAGEDAAVAEFWQAYGGSLQKLAASRMSPGLQRRVGADDVVQSVCRTFFRRSREGEFELSGTSSLWRLLCALTLTKVRQFARFHYQAKRRIDRERDVSGGDSQDAALWEPSDSEPTPAEIAAFADEMQRLFERLEPEERRFVELRIEGFTQSEIAAELGCAERTVRRLLTRVKEHWEQLLHESLAGEPR